MEADRLKVEHYGFPHGILLIRIVTIWLFGLGFSIFHPYPPLWMILYAPSLDSTMQILVLIGLFIAKKLCHQLNMNAKDKKL